LLKRKTKFIRPPTLISVSQPNTFTMKFILPVLCLTTGLLAAPAAIEKREVAFLLRSLKEVGTALGRLESSIKALPRNPAGGWSSVELNCHAVTDMLTSDSVQIRRAPMVAALEAPALLSPITNLETLTNRVVNAWISAHNSFQPKDRPTIRRILGEHQAAAGSYADAILSRQSALTAPVGRAFSKETKNTIQRGINRYRN
jgi:hypothetical protein